MSTLSFQDFVRERMLRRRHEALQESNPMAAALAEREPELPRPTARDPASRTAQPAAPKHSAPGDRINAPPGATAVRLPSWPLPWIPRD